MNSEPPILFLDCDGALNNAYWMGSEQSKRERSSVGINDENFLDFQLDPGCVRILSKLIEATGCHVVISSTWRKYSSMGTILRALRRRGLEGKDNWDAFIGMTPVLNQRRGNEIQAWLDKHRPVWKPNIAILDDDGDMEHLMPFLVACNGNEGLTTEKASAVIEMFHQGSK